MSDEEKEGPDLDVEVGDYHHQADPVDEFANHGWLELRRFLKTVSSSLPWGEMLVEGSRVGLKLPDIQRIMVIAASDLFGASDDITLMVRLKCTQEQILLDRDSGIYRRAFEEIEKAAEDISSAKTLEEWVTVSEPAVARATVHHALFSKDGRSRSTASTAINDRLMAKKGREEGSGGRELILPEGMLKLMKETVELQRQLQAAHPERSAKIIDASKVHEIVDEEEDG